MSNAQGGRAIALCAVLALAGFARPVLAEDAAPSVAVLPYAPLFGGVPQSTADKATEQVSTELSASNSGNDFRVVDTVSKKSADAGKAKEDGTAAARKSVQNALTLIEKGKTLAAAHKFPPAVDNLEKGISSFLAHFQGADDFKQLSEAYVQLALADFKLGKDEAGAKALDDLIRIDPERVLTAAAVAKELASRHAKQRSAYFAKPRGSMRIDSVPAGAKVFIDGRELGETPLLATATLVGDHYVRIEKDGVGSAFEKLTVGEEQEKISFTLAEEVASGPLATISGKLKKNTIDSGLLTSITKVGNASKADYVVFGGIRKNTSTENLDLKSYALRTKDGAIAELPDLAFDPEMLGANIEVLKLVTDLLAKISGQTFAEPPGALTLFEGIQAPKNSDAPSVVAFAPASTGAASAEGGETASGGGETRPTTGPGRRRGPVTAEDPSEAPAKAAPEVAPAAEPAAEAGGSVLEQLRRKREKAKQDAREPKEQVKPKASDEEPETRRSKRKDDEEPAPRVVKKKGKKTVEPEPEVVKAEEPEEELDEDGNVIPKKKVNLAPPKKKKSSLSTLSPEQLEKMKTADHAAGNNTGLIIGCTVGGAAVVAGAIVLGVIFLSPKAATSATAHVTW